MLKVENLTKIYSKGEKQVVALKEVSFTLGSTGFVFITGKSGCGKSTLLNMIGGLDSLTSGKIVCDGNDLSSFSIKDFDNYRNTYLGFVFQDYCLIDDLNVYQNVELGISLKGEKLTKEERLTMVDDALKSVDLDPEIKNRFVKELSGGQKQRVAIARALIKNPRLILADEPTGNLDSKTSTKILKLLKRLSKDRLVVIVSHNLEDAKQYASRIIELSDGQIVSDIMKKDVIEDKMSIKAGVLTLPNNLILSNKELKEINEKIKQNKIKKIKQNKSGFVKTKEEKYEETKVNIVPQKLSFKKSTSLAKSFLRKRIFASITTIFVITMLVFVLGLCQFFIQFNEAKTICDVMTENNEQNMMIYKGFYDEEGSFNDRKYVEIYDSEVQEFYDAGYTGNIYKVIKDPFIYGLSYNLTGGYTHDAWSFFKDLFMTESFGTMICEEDYLVNKFGVNGEVQILAGNLTDNPGGLIITDYMADSMIQLVYHGKGDYNSLVGRIVGHNERYVNAIIKTDYKEKYFELFKYVQDTSMGINREVDKEKFKSMVYDFMSEVEMKYGLCYSLNPNYIEDTKVVETTRTVINYYTLGTERAYIYENGAGVYNGDLLSSMGITLEDNEIALDFGSYNKVFGKAYGYYDQNTYKDFEPIVLSLTRYNGDENCEVVAQKEVVLKSLFPSFQNVQKQSNLEIYVSDEVFEFVQDVYRYNMALILDDVSQLDKVYPLLQDGPFYVSSEIYDILSTVGEIVTIFNDLFGLILLGVACVSVLLLVTYAYGNIKKRYYEIGVLKALGATTNNVGFVFSLQTILAGISICVFSTIMLLTLVNPINNIISSKLFDFVGDNTLGSILILKTNPITIITNIGIILLLTTVSCVIPLIKLNKIKPKKIIASKE